jgi:hypothetical protein
MFLPSLKSNMICDVYFWIDVSFAPRHWQYHVLTPQDLHWQFEPQLQELGPEHWQGPIVYV